MGDAHDKERANFRNPTWIRVIPKGEHITGVACSDKRGYALSDAGRVYRSGHPASLLLQHLDCSRRALRDMSQGAREVLRVLMLSVRLLDPVVSAQMEPARRRFRPRNRQESAAAACHRRGVPAVLGCAPPGRHLYGCTRVDGYHAHPEACGSDVLRYLQRQPQQSTRPTCGDSGEGDV